MSRLLILITTLLVVATPMAGAESPQETAERLARLIDGAETVPRQALVRPAPREAQPDSAVEAPALPVITERRTTPNNASQNNRGLRPSGSQSILERHRTTPLPRVFVEETRATPSAVPQVRPVAPRRQQRAPALDECREPAASASRRR